MSDPASSPSTSHLSAGRLVIEKEAQALLALASGLDQSFADAVELLAAVNGRIAVTGMGKSGHVGRKLAATFSSTGSPSCFIHPAEASHGDLGALSPEDAVLALSNSGNSAELEDILNFAARRGMPIIAMTRNPESFLGRTAACCLTLPDVGEACPLGCAPTSSTTMMMALGDALAVALLEKRGFSADDFHLFHPGGSLGRKLRQVADIMHTGEALPLLPQQSSVPDALLVMTGKGFGCVGLTDAEGRLCGIISDGDLRRHMSGSLLNLRACDIMTAQPRTITADALVPKALHVMNSKGITSLFVVDGGNMPQGIVHIHDCLRAGA